MKRLLLLALLGVGSPSAKGQHTTTNSLAWQTLPQALENMATTRRPVLIYVQAPWCGPCRRMERDVFPPLTPLLARFILARLDFDEHDAQFELNGVTQSAAAWARHLGADTTPCFIFLDRNGSVITRTTGFIEPQGFGLLLAYVATGAQRHTTFAEYVRRAGTPDLLPGIDPDKP